EAASQASDGSPTDDSNTDDSKSDDRATDDRATDNSSTDDSNPDNSNTDDGTVEGSQGEPVDNSDGSIRYAVLEGGQLFLRGRVHSEAYGQRIEEVALGVMGPGNVINEYEVDPDTPDVIGGPVYVEDVVLFEFNSIEVAPAFLPILDLGTALMTQNPTVEITIVSRTDSAGSEAVNMDVSEQRAGAVVNYWARQGIDTSRLTIDARGEEEASAGDDESEAALDRRVEFIINNLFG
ncbi:MAG: OmpA family protein, partial [Acidimicrobiia bacterium]|nr:OmpA family protein [Acidimicrobiia bacterium]